MKWWCQRSSTVAFRWKMRATISVVGCVELSIPGRTYGLHDIAMFNLLKVMEICLHENEANAALTYEGLLEQIRARSATTSP